MIGEEWESFGYLRHARFRLCFLTLFTSFLVSVSFLIVYRMRSGCSCQEERGTMLPREACRDDDNLAKA